MQARDTHPGASHSTDTSLLISNSWFSVVVTYLEVSLFRGIYCQTKPNQAGWPGNVIILLLILHHYLQAPLARESCNPQLWQDPFVPQSAPWDPSGYWSGKPCEQQAPVWLCWGGVWKSWSDSPTCENQFAGLLFSLHTTHTVSSVHWRFDRLHGEKG